MGGDETETVYKQYEALVCGHMVSHEGEIDLPLVRDRSAPPFMRVGIENSDRDDDEEERLRLEDDETLHKHKGCVKMMRKAPKQSLTLFRVIGREYLEGLPVTRLELVPITGRTHQLRVHMAAIGDPIIGDKIYGWNGDGTPDGDLSNAAKAQFQHRASDSVQKSLYDLVQRRQMRAREEQGDGEYNGNLTLHARQLNFLHPITKAFMSHKKFAKNGFKIVLNL
jgi:23S rRNA-/tRNA-specific pseudouridylate synthase